MKIFALLAILTMVTGCQSAHKLTYPKGKWQAINQAGFIPPNAQVYHYDLPSDDQKQSKTNTAIDTTISESVLATVAEQGATEEVKQLFESVNTQSNSIQE